MSFEVSRSFRGSWFMLAKENVAIVKQGYLSQLKIYTFAEQW